MTNLTDSQLLKLARDAYNDKPDYSTDDHQGFVPDGYQEVYIDLNATIKNQETGKEERIYDPAFKARSYYNPDTNDLIIAPAGTDGPVDLVRDDPSFVFGYLNPQFDDAERYYNAVLEELNGKNIIISNENITLTGHSLGGGLASMLGVYKGVQTIGFNDPGISRQLDNIEKYDDDKGNLIKTGQLSSKDPSEFTNIRHIVLKGDFVHLAGDQLGSVEEIDANNTILGSAITSILGAASGLLLAGPIGGVGGASSGLLTKFFSNGLAEHLGGTIQEALDQKSVKSETTVQKFLNAVGSIDSYVNKATSSVVDVVNKAVDWLTSGHVATDLTGAAKDAWNSTVSFFEGLFDGNSGSAPKNSDGTVNANLINNSFLDLSIRTDLTKDFLSNNNNNINQTGNALGDGDWEVKMPINIINGDGYKNVATSGIVTDFFRPGNQEISSYTNFSSEIKNNFVEIDRLTARLNQIANQPPQIPSTPNLPETPKLNLDFNLQSFFNSSLANISNNSINARTFLNIDPVVLDLNGDGVKLTSYQSSEVTFDVDNDGKSERTGWVSNQDGILVDDKNHNGKIDNITETISEYYNPNDGSIADADGKYISDGLAALKKLDSNNDGKFNNQDAKWNDLRVWVDANSDAQTDVGELKTLNEAGIKEIDLSSIIKANKERNEGNIIFSKTTYTTTDNQTKQLAAVDFTTNPIGYEFNDVNLGKLATAEDGTKSLVISDVNGATISASDQTAQNIFGNVGNDTIIGDSRDNWISGGAGSDTLQGGAGDDILIIDSEDKQENIDGGNGRDVVIINSDSGISFNLSTSHVETAIGGNGDDVLIGGGTSNVFIDGGSGDDIIIGGAADDALAGSDGNDYVDGGYGDDVIRGHRGNDVLIGGEGNDYLEGGLDDDKVFGGSGNDIIMEGAGNDEIDGGDGYDLVKYNGSYKDYKISRDGANYKVQDLKTGDIDSIKNIEGVRFNDVTIKLIDGNISPLPVADIIQIQNKTDSVFISKNELLANDLDVEGDILTIISVQNSVGGFAELVKDSNGSVLGVRWTPDKSFIGNMSFDYDIKDSKGAYTVIEQRNNDGTSATAAMKARVTFKLASDPTDELYTKQWYLSEVNVQKAWQDYTGKGIKIGVFEKGDFNINHAELDGNTLQSYKDDVAFRQVDQFSQHKTTVAGVIAAERNGTGIVGVAYDAKLEGYSWNTDETGLANLKNVDIANNSWGAVGKFADNFSDAYNPYINAESMLKDSVALGRDGLGTINVFAGGNQRQEGDNVNYHNFQNSRFVITTGSINQPGDLATLTQASTPFSNPGDAILVSAPGSNINSTGNLLTNANGSQFLGEFASSQGTSFSAPIISGVVALMLQANPNLGYRDVQKILALSARQFNDPNTTWQENGATNWNGGAMHFSHDYGFGEVDAAAAVRLAETWDKHSTYYNENFFTIENSDRIVIADNATVGKQFTITKAGMHNIETVEVEVNLSHLSLSDLTIKLVSPSGTESILMDKPSNSVYEGGLIFNFSSRAFLGENVDGDWKLLITDSKTGDVGYLNSWKLKFYGELNDGKNDTYIYTDEFAKMTDGSRVIISDNDGGVDSINASAVSSDTIINLNAGKISKIAGHDVLISGETLGDEYYQKKALLPTKEAELVAKNSQLAAKNQKLAADNIELAGIDSSISQKYNDVLNKQNIEQAAYNSLTNNELYGWNLSFIYVDGSQEYYNFSNGKGQFKSYIERTAKEKINSYNQALSTLNQKQSDFNSSVQQYNSLLARYNQLPSEISGLQNDIATLTNELAHLRSDINFINAYLDVFEDGKVSIIENAYTGDGNDIIIGNDQDNKIWGGRGINTETGGAGKDTFIIKQNVATQDIITDFEIGEDKIDLSDFGNFDFSKLKILQNGSNVEITLISGQKIILKNLQANQISASDFIATDKSLEIISGSDANDIINGSALSDVISGGNGDDQINGNLGNDILAGNSGNDILTGGDGNDDYVFNLGDGKDVIKEYLSASNSSNDRISFGSGITKDMIYFTKSGDDLVIKFTNNVSDQITISDYFNQSIGGNGLEKLEFINGDLINISDPASLVITYNGTSGDDAISVVSGNSIINSGEGNDTIYSGSGNDIIDGGEGNDEIHDGAGNDTIIGGKGNDVLALNMGDDIYVYNLGDGKDLIQNFRYFGIEVNSDDNADKYGIDTISFGQSIDQDSIYFAKSGNDLIIKFIGNNQDQITLKNHWSLKTGVTTLKFQDGTSLDVSDVSKLQFFDIVGDKNDNIINGTIYSDAINGAAGNDTINGGDGNDNIVGGTGNDILSGDGGDDIIDGGEGNDNINGGVGNDELFGGAGDDMLVGGDGNNQLQGGEGNDIIDLGTGVETLFYSDQVNFAFGEGGSDRFVISDKSISFKHKFDVIADFDVNDPNEKIDLSRVKGVGKYSDLKIFQNGSDTYIVFNTNFFGYSQVIKLENIDSSKLDSSKFILSNQAPEVENDSISTEEDQSIIINILANDSDDKTEITKTKITVVQPVNGAVTINSDGTVTYKPKVNFAGIDQFEYQLTDAGGAISSKAQVTVTINPVNDAPIVTKIVDDQTFYSTRGINFSVNDVFNDVDEDVLIYAASLADGSPLPNWISFNSETMIFSGKSPNSSGVFTIKLTATDGSNASTSTNIKLTINDNIIVGTDADDTLIGSAIDNVIDGGLGNDIIVGGSGNEVIFGGSGNDQLSSGSGNDKLYGEAGDDILKGNSGNQLLDGGDGNDKLYSAGSGSNDILTGGSGSDIFVIGNDIISNDIITDFNVADPNEKIDLSLFKDVATDISQLEMEQIGADTKISFSSKSKTILIKNVSMDQLTAAKFIGLTDNKNSGGSIVINGTTGNDTLTGGAGNDIIKGDKGNDVIKGGIGSNLLTGGAGDDIFVISKNPGKTDFITDFEAFDTLSFDGFVTGTKLSNFSYTEEGSSVTFNLGDGQNLTFQNAKAADLLFYLSFTSQINLSDSSAVISYTGTAADEKIVISTRNRDGDVINGGDGNDLLIGNTRDDTLNGGKGNDTLVGGDWSDIFEVNKNPGDKDTIIDLKINDMVDSIVLKGFADSNLANYPATQTGNDVVINLGDGQTLTLKNFKAEDVPYIASYSNRIYPTQTTTNGTDGDDLISRFDIGSFRGLAVLNGGKGNDVLKGSNFSTDYFVIDKNPSDRDFVRSIDSLGGDKVIFRGFGNDILDRIKFLPSSDQYTLIMDLGDGQILRTYGVTQSQFRQYFDVEKIINPTDGDDILSAGYFSTFIDGGAGNDVIMGNNLGNTLSGGDGNDIITAGDANDTINGGSSNDKIITGAGNDIVNADSGNDEINITDDGNKTITGGDGSDIYKISAFTGDISITDFAINDPNEKIDLKGIPTIFSFSDLVISQSGSDAIIQLSSSQKIILKNTDKNLLTADKFVLYNNQFDGSPINDIFFGGDGNDIINGFGGNDSVYLDRKGSDIVDLGDGNDSFIVMGNGYQGNDNINGGAGNDKFSIDLGYTSYDTTNYILTINDFDASNPNEKIYISNGYSINMDFAKDLKIDQIGNDVQIKLNDGSTNKALILKNINKADLNENNIVLSKTDLNENNIVVLGDVYNPIATESDDIITYDQNAGLKNLLGQDRGISVNGTMTNISMVISGNNTTITLKAFDPSKDRIKVDPSYGITKYPDMPLVQEGSNVVMNFVNENVSLSTGGSFLGATRYTKIVLENVSLTNLKEDNFIFYNHSTSGNDNINGLDGNDYIEGGEGNDIISGGNGNDKLLGGNGNDSISGDAGDDEIYGGDGNDFLFDYSGNNKIYGGRGDDNIGISSYYGASQSNNEIYGEEGDDRINVDFGANVVKGGTGNDEFIVYGGDNQIYGEDGVDDFIIGKFYSATSSDGINYVITEKPSSTTIHDFDPSTETIMLDGFDKESLDDFDIVQDGNDAVFNLSSVQTLRLSNLKKSSLNQNNIIIPNKHIHDSYYYTFDDRTNEYSIEDLNKLIAENPDGFYQGPVAEIASGYYDPVLMKMVSNFDAAEDKIHLGKIKRLEKFEDLKITQHSISQSYGAPSEFTLIDLGNGTFVKLNGFYNLTADNFNFNKAPTANLSSANINEDSQIVLDVVSKAVDIDDDVLSITGITSPLHGSATTVTDEQGRQKISYIPNPDFNGIDQFSYTISDGRGGVVTKTLTVTVNSINDNPTATITSATTNEDNSVIIDVLAGASDADGDQLLIAGIYNITNGLANVVDGKIIYTPNANYNGLAKFDYLISDGNGGFITKALNIDVNAVNDTPTITSIIAGSAVEEDASNIVVRATTIASAFSDADGDVLTYKASLSNGDPLPSWLTINSATGEIISTNPSNNQVGNHEIVITATDPSGASVSQNFAVTVNNVNDTPTAQAVLSSTNEDNQKLTLAFNASDVDAGDSLTYNILSNPAFGSIINNNDGTFTFDLGSDFQNLALGQTKDVSFTYVATDNFGAQSNISTAKITVTGTNDTPIASITSTTTNEDNSVIIDVLAGALDVDIGDVLSLTSVSNGLHGTASIITDANGNKVISYVPNANYNGSDVITYTISDNNGTIVTKELAVAVNAVNDAPIVALAPQNQAIQSGKAFTYQLPNNLFSDVDGDNLSISATLADGSSLPSWLSFDGTQFSGTPNVSLATNFAIKLTATDPSGASVSSNFSINVTNPNNAPIAKDDAFATNEDTQLTITFASILKNDSDIEDKVNIQKLTKDNIIFNNPANGTITITNTGIIYKPNKDYNGSDVITYQIKDSGGVLSNVASINLTVKPVNDTPVAVSDSFATNEDAAITIKIADLLANDLDVEDGINIQNTTFDKFVFGSPSKGKIVKDAVNGTITYTPNKNYNGTDSLTYQIKDSNGVLSNKATINLTINAINDAPVASTKIADKSVKAGNLFSYTLPANSFTDVDKDVLTYSAKLTDGSDLPSWLKFDSATKTFSGTSPSGIASSLSIKVTASDGSLEASSNFSLKIASNVISGNSGNNTINGTASNDEIYGNDGNDTIKGNAGNDLIIGGKGADVLIGGSGNDQFIFKALSDSTTTASDLILDFIKGEDKINLSGLGFDEISLAGSNQSDHGLEYHFDGTNTIIDDPNSNFAVKLAGDISLDHNDFVF